MTDSYIQMGGRPDPATTAASNVPPAPSSSSASDIHATRGFWNQLHAFHVMSWPYFREQWKARLMFGIMIVLTLLNSGVRVVFSYLARDFWSALSEERQEDFYGILKQFVIAMIILAPINVLYRYQRQMLTIHWREWMTQRVLQLYFTNRVYYGLERTSNTSNATTCTTAKTNDTLNNQHSDHSTPPVTSVDNPDQRITDDIRAFTAFSLTLFLTVLMSVVDLICFSVILYTIMPELFLAIAGFAAFGTTMTMIIGRVLVQLNFDKLQKEATLRYTLVRIRENAESIAFLRGEAAEANKVHFRLDHVIANMHALNRAVRNLDFFQSYYYYLTWVLPIAVVAPQYFAGAVELGVIQQATSAFSHVLDDLSILVTQWESLTEFGAGIDRLYTFLRVSQRIIDPYYQSSSDQTAPLLAKRPDTTQSTLPTFQSLGIKPGIRLIQVQDTKTALVIENLTLATPQDIQNPHHQQQHSQRRLLYNLQMTVNWGENLLICGPSGAGKSSLLRAIAGLWHSGSGTIQRPADGTVYFLPQKPYCSLGSLRDQLLYPTTTAGSTAESVDAAQATSTNTATPQGRDTSDAALLSILRAVDLAELPERAGDGDPVRGLDTIMDWSNTLSLGEQQRLAFGRLLVNRPRLVILDESTSALDMESEKRMYSLLQTRDHPITHISVGHRPSLEAYHHTKLTLEGEDKFTVRKLRDHLPAMF